MKITKVAAREAITVKLEEACRAGDRLERWVDGYRPGNGLLVALTSGDAGEYVAAAWEVGYPTEDPSTQDHPS